MIRFVVFSLSTTGQQFAVIELTDADITKLTLRREAFLEAKVFDKELVDHRYTADDASFYDSLSLSTKDPHARVTSAAAYLGDQMYQVLEDGEWHAAYDTPFEVDSPLIIIEEIGASWSAQEVDGEEEFRTELILWKDLIA